MDNQRRIATVTQINNYIKAIMDQTPVLQNIWIKGEISNLKFHSSGHIYLTLKDSGSVLKAVMFRGFAGALNFKPKDGTKVLARGKIGVYEAGGQYQLYVEEMEEEGQGDLYAKFERLKKQLSEEGLFNEDRKKPIPKFPSVIGIATSPTGAAVRDMINILRRRCPMVKAILYPCLVQGEGAAQSVKEAIDYFNKTKCVDIIIIGRGGGSIEDLWAFNEELTARAVASSEIPVISAVGHETDFTISDFVADLRAPTPSAAAELAVPDILELKKYIDSSGARLSALLKNKLDVQVRQFRLLSERTSITNFSRKLLDLEQSLDKEFDRVLKAYKNKLKISEERFFSLCGKLSALSPLSVFERGYCAATKDGKGILNANEINVGDSITLRLKGGELDCDITGRRLNNEF